jgi:hypothetical protein
VDTIRVGIARIVFGIVVALLQSQKHRNEQDLLLALVRLLALDALHTFLLL